MLSMFLYAIGMMFSPGPMNFVGVNIGITDRIKKSIGFYFGIGVSVFAYCIILGYTGEKIIKKEYLLFFSIIGSMYIIYLAYKIWNTRIKTENISEEIKDSGLSFIEAFIGQTFNPKAPVALLPITILYFPANNIVGVKIIVVSMILGLLGSLAPFVYSVFGKFMRKIINNSNFFIVFNRAMAVFLAFLILKEYVFVF